MWIINQVTYNEKAEILFLNVDEPALQAKMTINHFMSERPKWWKNIQAEDLLKLGYLMAQEQR